MTGYGDWAWYGSLWMTLGLAACASVVGLFVYAVNHRSEHRDGGTTAEEILRRRLANGEIDTAEYESLMRTLRG